MVPLKKSTGGPECSVRHLQGRCERRRAAPSGTHIHNPKSGVKIHLCVERPGLRHTTRLRLPGSLTEAAERTPQTEWGAGVRGEQFPSGPDLGQTFRNWCSERSQIKTCVEKKKRSLIERQNIDDWMPERERGPNIGVANQADDQEAFESLPAASVKRCVTFTVR